MNSINHPWGISEKFVNRYGKIWSEMDFIVNNKLTNYLFKTDPMNATVGTLHICGKKIPMKYKHLISSATTVSQSADSVYFEKPEKHQKFVITIGNTDLYLKKHEIGKLAQTLSDALTSIVRSYELGLYL